MTPEKTYTQMTPAERLADRIRKNREIDSRVAAAPPVVKSRAAAAAREKNPNNALDRFQQIKKTQGIDAASDYLLSKRKA